MDFTATDPGIHLLDRDLYADDPYPAYAWLRAHAPVYWSEGAGLWGVSRHADVIAVEKQPDVFSNGRNGSRPFTPKNSSMIDQDDPRHRTQRKFVAPGFTPKAIAEKEPHVRSIVRTLLDRAAAKPSVDLVADLAAPLPMILIAEMLGVRPEDRDRLQHWSDVMIGGADGPANVTDDVVAAHFDFVMYALDVLSQRRADPYDDLMGILVREEIDGEILDDDALVSEALLLLVGGNETTRNVISGGLLALMENPEQLALLRRRPERIPDAVEECLRWVSPVLNMNRTATRDVEMHGRTIRAGDQVLVMYASANRDDVVFDRPDLFDVTRSPNPHIAFGFGVHFCLGAMLARMEIRVMLEEVLARFSDVRLAPGALPERSRSSFIRGLVRLPVELVPA